MAKNAQKCAECGKVMLTGFRMKLMMGPKGFRQYPVHPDCADLPPAKMGGRQKAKNLTPRPSPEGEGMKAGA